MATAVTLAALAASGGSVGGAGAGTTTGTESFHGGLVTSGASGHRRVVGSVVAASGVFDGVGRIVERPNRPGEGDELSRDDLVFAGGTLHILNRSGRPSLALDRRTCKVTFAIPQRTTLDGGTGRFADATGTFSARVTGSGVARRTADGSCDMRSDLLAEVDTVSGTGTLTF